ncbi:MAG TPA: hypothetical protein VD947_00265, partial [Patescibacteria group bacterium]|nr:hypothetical protein [Patescibacteria group bacterium]
MCLENASSLLVSKLRGDGLLTFAAHSINFDQKGTQGQYRYHRLPYLKKGVQKQYTETMDQIFDIYFDLIAKLTNYISTTSSLPKVQDSAEKQAYRVAKSVLPVAVTSNVDVFAPELALNSTAIRLLSDKMPEAREAGRKILRTDLDKHQLLAIGYQALTRENTKKITDKLLTHNNSSDDNSVTLIDIWPKDELDIVPDILYENSSLSLNEIKKQVKAWSTPKKSKVLKAYIGDRLSIDHKPGHALEKLHYSWDILGDYTTFVELQGRTTGDYLTWQNLTPRYGFDVPTLIENAGLTDDFEKCF